MTSVKFNKLRLRALSGSEEILNKGRSVVYWMSRDQRVQDNWALIYSQELALKNSSPLHVCFCLVPKFLDATIRQYDFLLNGLKEVEKELCKLNIPFHLLLGKAEDSLPSFIEKNDVGAVICDFSPLRVPRAWVTDLTSVLPDDTYYAQVDAHNIVPCWVTSDKQEYAARTIRNKIHRHLDKFCTEFPIVTQHKFTKNMPPMTNWKNAFKSLEVNMDIKPVDWAIAGSSAGLKMLHEFIEKRLKGYNTDRNDPNKNGLSNLSPWFHFGQLSTQRAAVEVQKYGKKYPEGVKAFIEESVVRRELSDNFCFFNPHYDCIEGAANWAKTSLDLHKKDKRDHKYTYEQFESGKTHDRLWNAAQLQMVHTGKMHGFMRMYWAKKILEWTESPEQALEFAIKLNDKFELDGRDPNGYVGCMWSICGIHDQGWREREVFGKIRFMNFKGCQRKFDVEKYIKTSKNWMLK